MKAKFDADFIAHARNVQPILIEIIKELRDALVDVRSELTHAKNNQDDEWCVNHICDALEKADKLAAGVE